MITLRVILLAGLLIATRSVACVNLIERIPGVTQEHVEFYRIGDTAVDADSLSAFIRFTEERCGSSLKRDCSDLAVAYLFARRFAEALALTTRLVAKYPADYTIVITHAAALELNGKAAEAIPFLRQAIAINPKSHRGSEWIHLRLLEMRASGAAPSPWALIGVDLRPGGVLVKPDTLDAKALAKQVHYQVNDRIYFTPKNDPLFGALLHAYADLLELAGYRSQAERTRDRAAGYGFAFQAETASVTVDTMRPAPSPAPDAEAAVRSAPVPARKHKPGILANWVAGIFVGLVVLAVVAFVRRAIQHD